jgi:hypothetical protein
MGFTWPKGRRMAEKKPPPDYCDIMIRGGLQFVADQRKLTIYAKIRHLE